MAQIDFNVLKNTDDEMRSQVKNTNACTGGIQVDYISEPHVACCLLVDTSGSMTGEKIDEVNRALQNFRASVCMDPLSAKRVDVCVIQFSANASIVTPFCPISRFQAPTLTANGYTSMGQGIRLALETVHEQVHKYHELGVECYKPFVLMLSDGAPTDDMTGVSEMIAAREQEGRYGHLRFHAFGVKGANMDMLASLTHRVLAVDKNDFAQVFNWVSKSMQVISRSRPSEGAMGAPLESNMYPYSTQTRQLPWND